MRNDLIQSHNSSYIKVFHINVWKAFLVCGVFFPILSLSQITFINEAVQRGVESCTKEQKGFGFGSVAADFDDDGDVDLFLARPEGEPDHVYRNLGDGTFENIATELGLASTERSRSGLWFDYDGDHRLDLLVTTDCYLSDCDDFTTLLRMYKQTAAGTFVETTELVGLSQAPISRDEHRSGAAVGDLNGDGYLDLVTGFWEGQFHVYINQSGRTFTDVTVASGMGQAMLGHWQPIIHDFNGDGLLDIYSTVDFSENKLWINQGAMNGVPILQETGAASACDNAMNDMGLTIGDFDEDGDPDLYATNILKPNDDFHNVLLRNDTVGSVPSCSEQAVSAGVHDGGWGWGATFFDVNNDTYLDIAETNGWKLGGWSEPPRLFVNQPDNLGSFSNEAPNAGLTATHWGASLLAVDIDRDGDLDLVESVPDACDRNHDVTMPLSLYKNQLENSVDDHNYLIIKPRIYGVNNRAIGAKVTVSFAARTLTRWITAGTSFLGQEPAEAYFGLAAVSQIDQVVVTWPDGEQTLLNDITTNQTLTINYTPPPIFTNGFESE